MLIPKPLILVAYPFCKSLIQKPEHIM